MKYRIRWIMNGETFLHDEKSFYTAIEWLEANKERFDFMRPTRIEILEKYNGEWCRRYIYEDY